MSVQVRVDLHRAEINNFLYSPAGPVARKVRTWSEQVRQRAVANAPKDTGGLASSSSVEINTHPGFVVGVIAFNARHAMWVHEGTGAFGPIRPRRGRYMRIADGRGRSRVPGVTYTRTARGQRGRPFLVNALRVVMARHRAVIRVFRR